jgi:hypothetical protein
MYARIVGPKEDLGDVHEGLTFFGHHIERDWSEIDPSPAVLKKLQGNRHVELSDAEPSEEAPAPKVRAHKPKAD